MGLDRRAREIISRTRKDLIARAAAFLLLSDSKSSFAIEGERPSSARAARWAEAIGQAGLRPLSLPELERLQRIVIGDARFVRLGLREEGGFVGTHDRKTREPVPDHVSARPDDLQSLISGIIEYAERATSDSVDPVVAAAALAFGFVYVHPFVGWQRPTPSMARTSCARRSRLQSCWCRIPHQCRYPAAAGRVSSRARILLGVASALHRMASYGRRQP